MFSCSNPINSADNKIPKPYKPTRSSKLSPSENNSHNKGEPSHPTNTRSCFNKIIRGDGGGWEKENKMGAALCATGRKRLEGNCLG